MCDPDAVVTMAMVAGAAFGMVENIQYIGLQFVSPIIRGIPFQMHIMCQMLMGMYGWSGDL